MERPLYFSEYLDRDTSILDLPFVTKRGLPMFEQSETIQRHSTEASAGDAAVPPADAHDDSAGEDGLAPEGTLSSDQVKLALRRVKDPELNLNIIDLGLVYDIVVEGKDVRIDMSLTSPGCPSGPEIMGDAENQLKAIPGVGDVAVNLIWSPPWTPERIEPRVRAYLGF
ncbi:MAG: metal-sulfur cluster assembly factor [Gemmatimonadaceae bacterium]